RARDPIRRGRGVDAGRGGGRARRIARPRLDRVPSRRHPSRSRMNNGSRRLLAGFDGHHVEVEVDNDRVQGEWRAPLAHLLVSQEDASRTILRLVLREFATSCFELNDSAGRHASGSIEYVMHHAGKWMIEAFASAHPEFVWLHAAAAARDGFAVLLTGSAGAG